MSNQHTSGGQPHVGSPEEAKKVLWSLLSPGTFFKFARQHPIITLILLLGAAVAVNRFFIGGLAGATNLDDNNPWGIWIGFDLLCGVALAAGGFTTTAGALLFNIKGLRPAVKPAILTAFLGYSFVVFALLFDVGRPWFLPLPVFWAQGTTSVLFEVGLCVMIYVTVLMVEWMPNATDWLGLRWISKLIHKATIPLTVMGVVLSTMHQSSLGALYLIAPGKLHPLWYTPYLPLQFFVSAVAVGMSMVIFEGTISHHYMHDRMGEEYLKAHDGVLYCFAKACSIVLFGYFCVKVIGLVSADAIGHLSDRPYGIMWLVEMFGGVALPCLLYAIGYRNKNTGIIKVAAFITVFGVVFNRFNISMFAFNYQLRPEARYFPSIQEFIISIFVVTFLIVCFRFIAKYMAIFSDHPAYTNDH